MYIFGLLDLYINVLIIENIAKLIAFTCIKVLKIIWFIIIIIITNMSIMGF
jgi:hypothetical protein